MAIEFKIPELGEGVKGGDVLRVLVKPGDAVAKEQPVLELETDKATIEVPSSVAGTVTEVKVKEGDKISVGQVVLLLDESAAGADAGQQKDAGQTAATDKSGDVDSDEGGGDEDEDSAAPARRGRPGRAEVVDISRGVRSSGGAASSASATSSSSSASSSADRSASSREAARPPAPAAPSVRRLARELGIDIHDVPGSGPAGRIGADDVTMHAKRIITGAAATAGRAPAVAAALPDFAKWGDVDRKPVRGVRRKTAEHLSAAWATIPHVTQCDKADVTDLEALRAKFGKRAEAAGGKLTVTSIALKVIATALKVFPQFNASIDMAREELIYKKYCHIGVAVDTDRGLLVPVIRDVDRKNIVQLAVELAEAAERARTKKTTPEEMQGGCFTITNLGGIGGSYFTPIVNHPEVAILGISRAQTEPVYIDGTFQPRLRLPLSLSYDHRAIDGADGIRFLRFIVEALEQPFLLSLQG